MTVTTDEPATVAKFAQYTHPERLVSTGWLAEKIGAGQVGSPGGIVLLESDEDVLLYDTGHIPGAVKIDWHTRPQRRGRPRLRRSRERSRGARPPQGHRRDDDGVFYGDKNNWWASYAFWVFQLFGFTTTPSCSTAAA